MAILILAPVIIGLIIFARYIYIIKPDTCTVFTFPSFPVFPSDNEGGEVDTEQSFWQRIANFFKWIGAIFVWFFNSIILGFRLVVRFLGDGSDYVGGR